MSRYALKPDALGGYVKAKRAAPKLLREDLRTLPGELVTENVEEGDKVHELDEPHVRRDILKDFATKASGGETPDEAWDRKQAEKKKADAADPRLEHCALSRMSPEKRQEKIDAVRLRVMKVMAEMAKVNIKKGRPVDMSVKHLWFFDDDLNHYGYRDGTAPHNSSRPKYLRDMKLEIDLLAGKLPETIQERWDARKMLQPLMSTLPGFPGALV